MAGRGKKFGLVTGALLLAGGAYTLYRLTRKRPDPRIPQYLRAPDASTRATPRPSIMDLFNR